MDKTGQNGQKHENLSTTVQPLVRLNLSSASGQTGQIGQNFNSIYKLKYFFFYPKQNKCPICPKCPLKS